MPTNPTSSLPAGSLPLLKKDGTTIYCRVRTEAGHLYIGLYDEKGHSRTVHEMIIRQNEDVPLVQLLMDECASSLVYSDGETLHNKNGDFVYEGTEDQVNEAAEILNNKLKEYEKGGIDADCSATPVSVTFGSAQASMGSAKSSRANWFKAAMGRIVPGKTSG